MDLEEKFDRGEDVLDYFDARKARAVAPQSKGSAAKTKFAYPAQQNSRSVVREKSARYGKKK